MLTMIQVSILLQTFFQDREANDRGKKLKNCKSFDVAYLQLMVELHSSLAFLNTFFNTLSNNFCEIEHFQKGGDWSP